MRYMTLSEMLTALRGEAGISQNVAHGVTEVEPHKALLRRVQEELYLALDWPALSTSAYKDLDTGTRYAAFPDEFDFEGVRHVWARDLSNGGPWHQLHFGIGPDQLNWKDSDDDQRGFPTQRWRNHIPAGGETMSGPMFEVWPVTDRWVRVRFSGQRKLFPLVSDSDKSTLDGPTVVLHAAAELLARKKAEDAALKLKTAMQRLKLLGVRQASTDDRRVNLALSGPVRPRLRPGIDYIPSGS